VEPKNPVLNPSSKQHTTDDFSIHELTLANRNPGTLLETLRHEVTPVGAHYLLNHFDVPYVQDGENWTLRLDGCVDTPATLSIDELRALPAITQRVTLECAGNGRRNVSPRWPSQPWGVEAVGTSEWTGTRLQHVLERVSLRRECKELVFHGTDHGVDGGDIHNFARSLTIEEACHPEVMLAWQMNGVDLPPQHGYPLRLIVPGWYGMASVKWLSNIEAIAGTFEGYQQTRTYRYRQAAGDRGIPVTRMRVKSLMVPPGIPDWSTRKRLLAPAPVRLQGRAWSGGGVAVVCVEVGINGVWHKATLTQGSDSDTNRNHQYAWQGWSFDWTPVTGQYELCCRATDANGDTQPLTPPWDAAGFGNNSVQKIEVWCDTLT